MFYENQPIEQQTEYKRMLTIIGNLTLLFSESDCPYLPYRADKKPLLPFLAPHPSRWSSGVRSVGNFGKSTAQERVKNARKYGL